MFHPDTELREVSPIIGYGVFATRPIPAGTLTYVRDDLEVVIEPDSPFLDSPLYFPLIDKYAYIDPQGRHVISWDIGKYVNHSCACNTLSTGYGFEIAIRDIQVGEEITDDYGLFNLREPFTCSCGHPACRGQILGSDILTNADHYDALARKALKLSAKVDQPLGDYVDAATREGVEAFLANREAMWSVRRLVSAPGTPK